MLRKKIIVVFAVSLLFNSAYAQQNILDSLKSNFLYNEIVEYIDNNQLKQPHEQLQKLEALDKLGRKKEAVILLENLLRQDSTRVVYYDLLAEYYADLGNYRKAYNLYETAFGKCKSTYLLQKMAHMELRLNQYKKCIASCDALLQKDTTQTVLRLQAAAYERMDSLDLAKNILSKAVKQDRSDYRALIKLSELLIEDGKYTEAMFLTDVFLLFDSLNYRVLQVNAKANFLYKFYSVSERKFQKLIDAGMNSATNYYYLGVSNYFNEKYEQAYDNLYEANRLSKGKNASILYHLGMAAYKYLFTHEADKYLTQALKLSTPDTVFMTNMLVALADVNVRLSRYNRSIQFYQQAYKHKPTPDVLYKIAYSYDNIKQHKKAIHYYQKYLKLVPSNDSTDLHRVYKKEADYRIKRLKEEEFMK